MFTVTFLATFLPKNYHNRLIYVKVIASQSGDFFVTRCTLLSSCIIVIEIVTMLDWC